MKYLAILIICSLGTGCTIYEDYIDYIIEVCSTRGGIEYINTAEHSAACRDGLIIDYSGSAISRNK